MAGGGIVRRQAGSAIRLRAEGAAGPGPGTAAGYAAVFDSWTTLGEGRGYVVREVVRPGAFRAALAERQDVRALFNHDANHLLGRSTSGTLRLAEDAKGLRVEIDLPGSTIGRDVAESLGRGDATQMSFAFLPRPGGEATTRRLEGDVEVTEIVLTDLDLFDVSIVTYPAYAETSVALRGGLTSGEGLAVRLAGLRARMRAVEARSRARRPSRRAGR